MHPEISSRAGRYARQQGFAGIGATGQARIADAKVAIVGCGALGTHLAASLARAGVGALRLVDRDIVEWSNLHRQILFDETDAIQGAPKALAAAEHLRRANSEIEVIAEVADLDGDLARDLAEWADLILDGTDSFETRMLLNDACVEAATPWIYAAVVGAEGMTMNCHVPLADGTRTACLRCLWREQTAPGMLATCETAGVICGAVSAVTGIAATEALKILSASPAISQDLVTFDLWQGGYDRLPVPRDPACPACGLRRFEWLNAERTGVARLCGRDTVQVRPERLAGAPDARMDLVAVATRWGAVGTVTLAPDAAFARLALPDATLTLFPDGRALVHGTGDPARARALYARYVGM
jgi:molybdopterin-synthase adenylyltransferase